MINDLGLIENVQNGFAIKYNYKNSKIYFPDFILEVNDKKYIIEIKSTWTYDNCGKNMELKEKNDAKFLAGSLVEGYVFKVFKSKEEILQFINKLNKSI